MKKIVNATVPLCVETIITLRLITGKASTKDALTEAVEYTIANYNKR